jgi:hypothetical protein
VSIGKRLLRRGIESARAVVVDLGWCFGHENGDVLMSRSSVAVRCSGTASGRTSLVTTHTRRTDGVRRNHLACFGHGCRQSLRPSRSKHVS